MLHDTGIHKTLGATVTNETFTILQLFGMSRGAPAEICRLPPFCTAIPLKTASDARVERPCRLYSCRVRATLLTSMGSHGHVNFDMTTA